MNIEHVKTFPGTPFSIECTGIENEPGRWSSNKISIYKNDILIGEYLRNYPSFGTMTFCPFSIDNDWYALYSASYTTTRVMKLNDNSIEDWCGDDSSPGFCPVELYVPQYTSLQHDDKFIHTALDDDSLPADYAGSTFCNFGFLCGCVWGDDSTWKIRYIDLAQIPNKILSITPKFGYWSMPVNQTLRQCVDLSMWEPDDPLIRLTKAVYIHLTSGEQYE